MKLIAEYLRSRRRTVLLPALFIAVYAVISLVYGISAEPVFYSVMLCLIIAAAAGVADFIRFRRKHRLLSTILENLPLMTNDLPEPDDLPEEELSSMVRRMAELHNENISRLRSIRADNTDYFTVWVHQIKTPISAMRMILQSEDTELSRDLSAELFRIEQYAEMALQYIRLDSETNDLVIRRCDVDTMIKQAVHQYAPLFIRRRIKLIYEPVHSEVMTDEKWLTFVIGQLLSNAVKYTISGTVTIAFSDDKLTVTDTGIGISAEDLPRIFEKGYTGLSGRTDSKSTGLGLYLCRRICDKLGHTISASSKIGEGSTFTIDLSSRELDFE